MNNFQQDTGLGFLEQEPKTVDLPELEFLERGIWEALSDSEGPVREMCSHILNGRGKRIRPLLVLHSGLIFSGLTSELRNAAVAAELIHMASLVHDDVIDNSSIRRHKPSVNSLWDNTYAVLCGDYLFAKAFSLMSSNTLTGCMNYMVEAIGNMCRGEIEQANNRFNFDLGLDAYYDCIAKKTAIFLACCCKSGAHASGADELYLKLVGEYGLNLGFAFQIIDDILDFSGRVEVMGKTRYNDLRQGNITLPVILLLNHDRHGPRARDIIKRHTSVEQLVDHLVNLVHKSGVMDKAFDVARTYITKAKQCLSLLPGSRHTDFLRNLADKLLLRTS
ncbi:MAG: polyprenyl synthetase family protein [Clostridiales bacterium]|nr:polyprenyl synthetase family protein [Clostridiales bacterium]